MTIWAAATTSITQSTWTKNPTQDGLLCPSGWSPCPTNLRIRPRHIDKDICHVLSAYRRVEIRGRTPEITFPYQTALNCRVVVRFSPVPRIRHLLYAFRCHK